MKANVINIALALGLAYRTLAQQCQTVIVPSYNQPTVANGWTAQLVVGGLTTPRSIQFDSSGALLVVERGKGVSRITFKDNSGTCLQVDKNTLIVQQPSLNHGLALSNDGKTLYASSVEAVFAWSYNAQAGVTNGDARLVVNGMSNSDLTTRTLLFLKKQDRTLLVSRGSAEDTDLDALNVTTGLAQIRAFDLTNQTSNPFSYASSGHRVGWGLRNAVAIGEHPITGGIYSMDGGIDVISRGGVDIHENNPGEELNYHGVFNTTTEGGNYGYPSCYTLWDTNVPDNASLHVGSQFSLTQNSTLNDEYCAEKTIPPRLTFEAHLSPLDIKFADDGATAYITWHGSFDKTNPVGYRISSVAFNPSSGLPTEPADSKTALTDIMINPDHTKCPGGCFRPVSIAIDKTGRLFMSSDSTGEIYVLQKTGGSGTFVTGGGKNSASGVKSSLLGCGLAAAVAVTMILS